MKVFRAMCEKEYELTLASGKPDFSKSRFKWFSPHLDFILKRVRDGSFNNSRHCNDRYVKVLEFEIPFESNNIEIQIDRRRNMSIKLIGEVYV